MLISTAIRDRNKERKGYEK